MQGDSYLVSSFSILLVLGIREFRFQGKFLAILSP
jgi:hypothetical protein